MRFGDMRLLRPISMVSEDVETSLAPAVAALAGEGDERSEKTIPSVKRLCRAQLSAANYAEAWNG